MCGCLKSEQRKQHLHGDEALMPRYHQSQTVVFFLDMLTFKDTHNECMLVLFSISLVKCYAVWLVKPLDSSEC